MTQVLPGVHLLRLPLTGSPLRHTNGYLIRADDGWTLVDCGWNYPDVLEALTAQAGEVGARLDDLRRLVITHFHSDHYGLAGTLVGLTQARLLMHRLDWLFVERELTDFNAAIARMDAWLRLNGAPPEMLSEEQRRAADMFARYTVQRPDEQLEDGHEIVAGNYRFQVVWTPGHSAGHICLYEPERKVLLTGDHVLDPITPNVSRNREHQGNPLGQYLQSLRKVAELDADLVLPAHGEPFYGIGRRVRELLEHHDEREREVLEAVSHGLSTGYEVASRLPWTRRRRRFADLPLSQQRMALTETLAHLEELRERGRIRCERRDDRLLFEIVEAAATPA
ncbi:MAG: MBL fold metallo-hydrolase [Chloroflexi bacterium]|nr:MBL fold metallo-hydrolase [Chloroflexota bacterium]